MKKPISIAVFIFLLTTNMQAQVVVKWDELVKKWSMNSAGYPADEPSLDSLYFRLHDFKLDLAADSSYTVFFSKDSSETGKFEVNKRKKELIFKPNGSGKVLAYSVAELTPDVLTLLIGEKYTWAFYLSLTAHE